MSDNVVSLNAYRARRGQRAYDGPLPDSVKVTSSPHGVVLSIVYSDGSTHAAAMPPAVAESVAGQLVNAAKHARQGGR